MEIKDPPLNKQSSKVLLARSRGYDIILLLSLPYVFLVLVQGIQEHQPKRLILGTFLHVIFITQFVFRRVTIDDGGVQLRYPYSLLRRSRKYSFVEIRQAEVVQGTLALSRPTLTLQSTEGRRITVRLRDQDETALLKRELAARGVLVMDDRWA